MIEHNDFEGSNKNSVYGTRLMDGSTLILTLWDIHGYITLREHLAVFFVRDCAHAKLS